MRRLFRRWVPLVVLLFMAFHVAPAPPAGAQNPGVATGVSQFNGTISPGLTALPSPQSLAFDGTLTGVWATVGGTVVGTASCSFSGSSQAASIAVGLSNVSGSCSGSGVTITCTGQMVTVGSQWFLVLTCTICINGFCTTAVIWIPWIVTNKQTPPTPVTSVSATGLYTAAGV